MAWLVFTLLLFFFMTFQSFHCHTALTLQRKILPLCGIQFVASTRLHTDFRDRLVAHNG